MTESDATTTCFVLDAAAVGQLVVPVAVIATGVRLGMRTHVAERDPRP